MSFLEWLGTIILKYALIFREGDGAMKRIGLTGGIASGKSTASAILRGWGACIIDADAIAHGLMEPGAPLYDAYRAHFGEGVILSDGHLNRRRIGQIAFANPAEKRWLDETAHPVIRRAIEQELKRAEAAGEPAVILDIPLLFETDWQAHVDESWLIDIPESLQLMRLQSRNGYSREEAKRRIAAQMPLSEKRRLADVIIDNSGTEQELMERLRALWQKQPHQAAGSNSRKEETHI